MLPHFAALSPAQTVIYMASNRHLFKVVKIEEAGQRHNDKKLFDPALAGEFFLSVVGYSVDFLNFQKES